MNNINEIQSAWTDEKSVHKLIADTLAHKVNEVPELKAHRDFIETNSFGFGERPFVWLHKLLVDEMPEEFTFMEIGVYKGGILSLYKMLADMAGKKVNRTGITPLSAAGNFEERDYRKDIITIHKQFNLEEDYLILRGLSTDTEIIKMAMRNTYDILYIDGGHDLETATSDILHYSGLIKKGGFLIVDDCANYLDLPENYFFGIKSVSQAMAATLPPWTANDNFEFLFNVGHNLTWRKIK